MTFHSSPGGTRGSKNEHGNGKVKRKLLVRLTNNFINIERDNMFLNQIQLKSVTVSKQIRFEGDISLTK